MRINQFIIIILGLPCCVMVDDFGDIVKFFFFWATAAVFHVRSVFFLIHMNDSSSVCFVGDLWFAI